MFVVDLVTDFLCKSVNSLDFQNFDSLFDWSFRGEELTRLHILNYLLTS